MIIHGNLLESVYNEDVVNGKVVVPNNITKISDYAFGEVPAKEIILPESLTSIGNQAFDSCTKLENIIIPDNVEYIGKHAFVNCGNLHSIKIPDKITTLSDGIFESCSNLTNVILPKNLNTINSKAFKSCRSLNSISIPDSVLNICESAFAFCDNLENVKLPKDLEFIGENAFTNCALKQVTMPENLKIIESRAFFGNQKLKDVVLNEKLEYIEDYAFEECERLSSITIPKSINKIGYGAFNSCGLTSVTLPDNLEILPILAFGNCERLTSIHLPKNLKRINNETFRSCISLKKIDLPNHLEYIDEFAFDSTGLEEITIPNSVISIDNGAFMHCGNLKSVVMPEFLEVIKPQTFYSCRNLSSVTLPKNLKSIQKKAFSECKNLETLVLPDGLKNIGFAAFSKSGIKSISIPDSVEVLSNDTFSVSNLAEIKLPANIKEIPSSIFFGCSNLKSIKIPDNVTTISSSAFNSCVSLKNVELPSKLERIDYSAFANCTNLEKVILPKSLKNLNNFAFSNCVNLKAISISEGLESIDTKCFINCTKLENIFLPDSIKILYEGVFSGCKNLKNIHLSKNLEQIKLNTFENCTSLENIELPNSLKIIDDGAFYGCKNLKSIIVPSSIESLGENIFENCNNLTQAHFPNNLKYLNSLGIDQLKYFKKDNDGFSLLTKPEKDSISLSELRLNPAVLSFSWKNKDILLNEQRIPLYADIYNQLLPLLNAEQCDELINSHNFKFIKQFNNYNNENNFFANLSDLKKEDKAKFFKAIYNLGGFLPQFEQKGKKFNYSQKVSEFLLQKLNSNEIDIEDIGNFFENTKIKGFNKEFTDFFLSNFDEFTKREMLSDGFIARCYNEFEEVQKTNTNHHGSQRQLKPTIEKFVDYFKENKYTGITDETRNIAKTIAPYFSYQESFDDAVKIYNEIKENKIPTNILGFHLKEENPFEKIDTYKDKIHNIQKDTLHNFVETANNEFTYDWLEKNDPQNYILGNLCTCCAHLDGVGFGIMKASMVHPNVQNLVIRNSENEIIAKSTLYINDKEGYGVCNNVEVNNSVEEDSYPKIYEKYIKGINAFAENYNKLHTTTPLKIINVGIGFNDLENELKKHNKYANKILEPINYSTFCDKGFGHPGDSFIGQFTIWENTNQNELEK